MRQLSASKRFFIVFAILTVLLFGTGNRFSQTATAAYRSVAAAVVSATMTGALDTSAGGDANGNGVVNPGDRIKYTTTVQNNSGTDATGLILNDTIDANTTLVAGSLNSSPIAFDQPVVVDEDNTLDITLTGADPDNNALTFKTVTTAAGFHGVLTGTAPNLTYMPNANFNGTDTLTFKVNDGKVDSNETGTVTITVNPVNDAPVLAGGGTTLAYTENGAAAVINNAVAITDVDSANLTGATVSISANLQANKDVLSFTNTASISGSYNGATGILTLAGTDTLTNYQAALRSVKYSSTSEDPSTLARTVTFQVSDGGAQNNLSNSVASTINVTAVNDAPTANGFTNLPAQAGIPITYPAGKLGGSDAAEEAANGTVVTISTTPDSVTGGTVVINANGSFTFTPSSGTAGGAASFTYHVTDNGRPGAGLNSASATVLFAVAGPGIYFVKSSAVGSGNCTLGNECALSTAITNIGAGTNAKIFISDANSYTQNVTLNSGGSIIGQGVAGTDFDTVFGISAPAQGTLSARPSINQLRPTLNGNIVLNANSSARGFNISSTSGDALSASGKTGLVVSDMNVTTTVNSSANYAVNLASSSGAFGFGDITVSGTNAGSGVNFNTTTSSSTVLFNNITTKAGAAFTASATGATNFTFNDLSSTTGIGVSVSGGTGSMTFHAVSVNGASKGISLTGSYAGAFSVTGTGTTAASGGTIQSISGRGVEVVGPASGNQPSLSLKNMNLTNTAQTNGDATASNCGVTGASGVNANCSAAVHLNNVNGAALDNVNVSGSNQNGINGLNVINLQIVNSTVQNIGNEAGETAVFVQNLTGTSNALTNSTFSGGISGQFVFTNWTSGALGTAANPFNVSGCTFTGKGDTVTPGGDGFQGVTRGTSTAYISVGGGTNLPSHFKSNYSYGFGMDTADTGNATVIINGADFGTLGNTSTYNNSGITIGKSGASSITYTLSNNTIVGSAHGTPGNGAPILITTGTISGGSMIGSMTGNTIGNAATAESGCASNCNGISLYANGGGSMTFAATISNNQIHQVGSYGIQYLGGSGTGGVTGRLHITNNTIDSPSLPAICGGGINCGQAIFVGASTSGATGPSTMCADISSNNLSGAWNTFMIRPTSLVGSTFKVGGMNGSGTATTNTYLASVNTLNGGTVGASTGTTNPGTFTGDGTTCPSSGLAMLEQKPDKTENLAQIDNQPDSQATSELTAEVTGIEENAIASSAALKTPEPKTDLTFLNASYQEPSAFLMNLESYGGNLSVQSSAIFSPDNIQNNPAIKTEIVEQKEALNDDYLTSVAAFIANVSNSAASIAAKFESAVSPTVSAQEKNASASNVELQSPSAGETVRVDGSGNGTGAGFTLPTGKTTTITFLVTVNSGTTATSVSNQGAVSGSNFSTILTDNPNTAAANDPTVTQVISLAPTAAQVTIGGRVLEANGRGISGARVTAVDQNGNVLYARTNPFGYYRFMNMPAGNTYILTAQAKNKQFNQPNRVVNLTEETMTVDFIAAP